MKRLIPLLAVLIGCTATDQPPPQSSASFKLGTFAADGDPFVGVVLNDSLVIDLAAANNEVSTALPAATGPTDMKDLIARYDELRPRIAEVIGFVEGASGRPAFAHGLGELTVRPPIMYPTNMVHTALNYREHATEMAGLNSGPPALVEGAPPPGTATPNTSSAPGIWDRADDDGRWNPYMFLKSPSTVIADGEAVRLPPGRTQIDWECELGLVIGRSASRVQLEQADDFIFGYTISLDVSDRGGRGDERYGSDWLIGKSHDTFAPMGPFITPKEFVGDPRDLDVEYSLNGETMQSANTSLMIHDVYEQVVYASNILTLQPGDVIATGSPAGVGSARNPPIFFQPGDVSVCSYDGIGTLTNRIEAAD